MKFLIADAFSNSLFGGNPAGVVILPPGEDFPTDSLMCSVAAELRYSETAFIKQLSSEQFNIRYFTPASEVDLCGHATIASFAALLHLNLITNNGNYSVDTLAGNINIEICNSKIMMDMAPPKEIFTISDEKELAELYSVMGLKYHPIYHEDINGNRVQLMPKIVSTGLPDIMLPVSTNSNLNAIAPDMKKLSALSEKYNVVGVHAFTLEINETETYNCRNFAPLYDIDEEAATGTSNGALTYYLHLYNVISSNTTCTAIQGTAMNRPSIINTSISVSNNYTSIKIGGEAVILAEGEIHL